MLDQKARRYAHPVDILKVDKSFIDAFNQDARKSALTATIIKLAADVDLKPVAEGIERADQLEQLLQLHCDLGQGFYFAKPLPLDGIDDLLTARRTLSDRDAELSSKAGPAPTSGPIRSTRRHPGLSAVATRPSFLNEGTTPY